MRQEATEGRSTAAPVQEGGEAAVGAQRGCACTGGRRGEGMRLWFMKGVVNVPSANTTRERDS